MFNPFKSFKKFIGLEKNQDDKNQTSEESKNILSEKLGKVSSLFDSALDNVVNEYNSIKEKSKDLSSTNLNLGLKYLEEGNLDEAIFRFKLTKKFWPNNYEAHFQLIICMILKEKFVEAEKLMKELSEKSPEYKAKIEEKFGKDFHEEVAQEENVQTEDSAPAQKMTEEKKEQPQENNTNQII